MKKITKERIYQSMLLLFNVGAILITVTSIWSVKVFGDIDFEQLWFTLTAPTQGTPLSFYFEIAFYIVVVILLGVLLTIIMVKINQMLKNKVIVKTLMMGLSVCLVIASGFFMNYKLKISDYYNAPETTFIQQHYIEPSEKNVVFPQHKKNLIYIYLESFEGTYFSKELGGNVNENLLPELTKIIHESNNVSFSDKDTFGGGYQAPSTGYSIAGMFAQQSGLPFKVTMDGNKYGEQNRFAPGAITLGDILQQEGYNLEFLVGADATFAGVDNFYQTHGDFNILDYNRAKDQGLIPKDYKEWWGFEDKKLFEYSRNKLEELSEKDEPFAIIIEADDTHFPNGYTDKSCSKDSTEPYENSIRCVDKMTSEFVRYIQSQDYYKDTVIVIHGDHLSMEKEYFKTLDENYKRNTFNLFINLDEQVIENVQDKNRKYYSMDVFPTILSSLNVKVKGSRLGIGTDMFSESKTLYEEYGVDEVNQGIGGKDQWFIQKFMK
ncbi:sulfatase-like hydrolase/transferase [Erysipelothrix urinaevulpis]|uniref:sulfatase-like hydrolase/transferase n=1 Tax=Erysipelothrix urinaevulpis TaxID=2683717 RepID=UPI0013592CC8|nr:sulfatase-like hydrolase/transferase [Erysipelothrix urinaevulpis]